ncbi:MAG TPA: ThiF family adenylyltransferase, partial [Gemmatimonadales bacterium]|nr:ThiF family adenylyltransferase [Gemmatimonadales bacterium]
MDDEFVIESPTDQERGLLEILARGYTEEAELKASLEARRLPTEGFEVALAQLDEHELIECDDRRHLLSPDEFERFDRQLIYFADLAGPGQAAEELQQRLLQAKVIVLGCGGLGSWAASALACAGVGTLVLIDDDSVELSNLNRQLLFCEADIGQPKIEAASAALGRHNPALDLIRIRRQIGAVADLEDLLEGVDLLVLTADSPPHQLPRWINQACLEAGVPYI